MLRPASLSAGKRDECGDGSQGQSSQQAEACVSNAMRNPACSPNHVRGGTAVSAAEKSVGVNLYCKDDDDDDVTKHNRSTNAPSHRLRSGGGEQRRVRHSISTGGDGEGGVDGCPRLDAAHPSYFSQPVGGGDDGNGGGLHRALVGLSTSGAEDGVGSPTAVTGAASCGGVSDGNAASCTFSSTEAAPASASAPVPVKKRKAKKKKATVATAGLAPPNLLVDSSQSPEAPPLPLPPQPQMMVSSPNTSALTHSNAETPPAIPPFARDASSALATTYSLYNHHHHAHHHLVHHHHSHSQYSPTFLPPDGGSIFPGSRYAPMPIHKADGAVGSPQESSPIDAQGSAAAPPEAPVLLRGARRCRRPHRPLPASFTPEVSPALAELVEAEVVACLTPSLIGLHRRRDQLRALAECITEAIRHVGHSMGRQYGDVRFYIFGSVNMRTVLPDGDNDITIEVDGLLPNALAQDDRDKPATTTVTAAAATTTTSSYTPAEAANYSSSSSSTHAPLPITTESNSGNKEGTMQMSTLADSLPVLVPPAMLTLAAGELLGRVADYLRTKPPIHVDALVLAEVRVLKLTVGGSSYDLTIGQFGGVNCVWFLHEMDAAIGGQHLLKRTLLLLKSWSCYEAHVLGGQAGYIGSYAATVLLIAMLNTVEFIEDVHEGEQSRDGGDNNDEDGDDEDASSAIAGGAASANATNTAAAASDSNDSSAYRNPQFRSSSGELTPLVLLARFLKFYSYFDFDHFCVTAFGPLPLKQITTTPFDLGTLEVDAAQAPQTHGEGGARGPINRHGVDTSFLGLTAEGDAAIGHLIRRRQRPLLTVAGVKHLLHEMNTSRKQERWRRYRGRHPNRTGERADGADIDEEWGDNGDVKSGGGVCLHRRADPAQDAELTCPSCNSTLFPVRCMNVLDPLRWSSNMVRGVCRNHLQRILRAFREGVRMLGAASMELDGSSARLSSGSRVSGSAGSTSSNDGVGTAVPSGGLTTTAVATGPTHRSFTPSQSSGGTYDPLPSYAQQSTSASGGGLYHGGGGLLMPPGDALMPGYLSPHSQCTRREVGVLQSLFGNTLSIVQQCSETICPWHRTESSAPGMPQCATCRFPSLLCTPDIARTCEPQLVFHSPYPPLSDAQQRPSPETVAAVEAYCRDECDPARGPLGEDLLPPLLPVELMPSPLPPPHAGMMSTQPHPGAVTMPQSLLPTGGYHPACHLNNSALNINNSMDFVNLPSSSAPHGISAGGRGGSSTVSGLVGAGGRGGGPRPKSSPGSGAQGYPPQRGPMMVQNGGDRPSHHLHHQHQHHHHYQHQYQGGYGPYSSGMDAPNTTA